MAEDVTLLIKLQDQASPKIRRLTQTTKRLEQAANGAQNSIRRTNKGIRDTGRAADRASKGVNKLGKAIRGLAAGFGVFQAGKFVIFKTAELERQTKSLEVLTGSLGNARSIIKELQQFGAVTPFTSSELIETAKRLKAFGFETEQVVDVTKRLADVAGATGADLSGIATAFGQIQAKGRLQGEELLQLQERGVSLQDELQKMYGLTADEFRKALEGGRISADAVNLALQNITDTGGKYANGAIAQSETLAGKFSTLVDGLERIAVTIGNVVSPALKGIINEAITAVNFITKAINNAALANNLGLSGASISRLQQQADKEAERLVNLRDPKSRLSGFERSGLFNELRQERFRDLLRQTGFRTGQLQAEISAPGGKTTTQPPALLSGRGGGGGTTPGTTPEERALKALKQQQKAAKELLHSKKQEALLMGDITEEQRAGLEHAIAKMNLRRQFPLLGEDELQVLRDQLDVNFGLSQQDKERLDQAKKLKELQDAETKRVEKLAGQYQGIADTIADGVVNALKGAVDGTTSLAQAATSLLDDLANQMLQIARNMLFFGNMAGNLVPGGGILGSIFGAFIPGFAGGGRPPVGRPSIVGERGPELFVPDRAGTIVPNHAMGGSNVVVNVDASGSNVQGDGQQAAQLGQAIGAAVQAELIKQKRPGGLLAS